MIAMVLVGLPIAGNYLFPAPLTADIIDYDALETGLRREAAYYGAQNFVEKTTSALTPLILGVLLTFGKTTEDPLQDRLAGPVAAVLVLVGYLVFRRYDLPDDVLDDDRYAEASVSQRGGDVGLVVLVEQRVEGDERALAHLLRDRAEPGPSPNRSRMYDCRWMHGE